MGQAPQSCRWPWEQKPVCKGHCRRSLAVDLDWGPGRRAALAVLAGHAGWLGQDATSCILTHHLVHVLTRATDVLSYDDMALVRELP